MKVLNNPKYYCLHTSVCCLSSLNNIKVLPWRAQKQPAVLPRVCRHAWPRTTVGLVYVRLLGPASPWAEPWCGPGTLVCPVSNHHVFYNQNKKTNSQEIKCRLSGSTIGHFPFKLMRKGNNSCLYPQQSIFCVRVKKQMCGAVSQSSTSLYLLGSG
jgi:hypothetical protein